MVCGPFQFHFLWNFFLKFLKALKSFFPPLLAHHFVCEKVSYIEDIIKNQTLYF